MKMLQETGISISPLTTANVDPALELLKEVFGQNHDRNWFSWKHMESPFGPSFGSIAVDQEGIIGVRLLMRWELQAEGRKIEAHRPVDTVTAPRARGKGVFRLLTNSALDWLAKNTETDLIFNTPNSNSLPGYNSMGWRTIGKVAHAYYVNFAGPRGAIEEADETHNFFDHFQSTDRRLLTIRSSEYIRWRYDKRSGKNYRTVRLLHSDRPAAMIYHIVNNRHVRILVVCECSAAPRERDILLRTMLRDERAHMALAVTGSGSLDLLERPLWKRGGSIIAVRSLGQIKPNPEKLDSWAFTLGDLEAVI